MSERIQTPRLKRFAELNAKRLSKREDAIERKKLVREMFPDSVAMMGPASPETQAAWVKAFERKPEMLGRMLRDILRADQADPSRKGARPDLDPDRAKPVYDVWFGEDPCNRPYSNLPFAESFALLCGTLSITQIARKTGLPRVQVHRLLKAEITPTRKMIEQVADGFKKTPSWFMEYRIGTVASILIAALARNPEHSVRAYEQLYHLGVEGAVG